jgi:hypothetical protein
MRVVSLALLVMFCFVASGCETTHKAAQDSWHGVKCADSWVKRNLW